MNYWTIADLGDLRFFIDADCKAMGTRPSLRLFLLNPVMRFQALLRLHAYLLNTHKPLLLRLPVHLWFRRLSIRLGFSIGPNVFGPGLAIVHYGTIVTDPTARVGKNCRLHVGVHIGGAARFVDPGEIDKYSPRIGDNVYLGPGAKLYGPITIGDDCVVGANAVVTKSFPERGLTLAGVPARVIAEGGAGERVIKGA